MEYATVAGVLVHRQALTLGRFSAGFVIPIDLHCSRLWLKRPEGSRHYPAANHDQQ
jgi:hypothetical protein